MRAPLAALVWEIWRRRRVSAYVVVACVAFSALVNDLILPHVVLTADDLGNFSPFFGILMVVSFLFVMGIFNYTENSSREWSGFPYRLFVLPIPTWQLVLLPMVLGVVAVEANYYAWIKLVWTHEQIPMSEWFAVVLGVYVVLYQTTLWSLAAFRATRLVMLAVGGMSILAMACAPALAELFHVSWITERRLIVFMLGVALVAVGAAWAAVARQRSGGGRRQSWLKAIADKLLDALPRSSREFSSPAEAQFWFEWRRAGWILPVCTTFGVLAVFVPFSWLDRYNSGATYSILLRLLAMPVVLAMVIGKGFVKPEFWTVSLLVTPFMVVRPQRAGELIVTKLKVAAFSVALAWLPVLAFAGLWLPFWAEKTSVQKSIFMITQFYPHAWLPILILGVMALVILSWRVMIGGLWAGMSGKRLWYYGVPAAQLAVIALVALACGLWSRDMDRFCAAHPELANVLPVRIASWILCVLVILKYWTAVFSWKQITSRRTWQYLRLWLCATSGLTVLAILARPPFDMDRQVYVYLLAALWVMPMARLGIAPPAFAKNRHR